MIRDREPYPHPQFAAGLKRAGFTVVNHFDRPPTQSDVLLTWNRSGLRDTVAKMFTRCGAKVIVVENGWIGNADDGGKLYAMSLDHHNGPGTWRVGEGDRLKRQNVELRPWRESGRHILMLLSRGIGEHGIAQPRQWVAETSAQLRRVTNRPIRLRAHPGDKNADLSADLEDAHAVVTWGSGAAIKAIAAGTPAFYGLDGWIGAPAAVRGVESIESPFLGDRLPMFRRMAWAQWSAAEISTGEPIRWLLSM